MIKVGDTVVVECFTSMGSGGDSIVTKITKRYDSVTGEPFNVIHCDDHEFHGDSGLALNPPLFYAIKVKNEN